VLPLYTNNFEILYHR